MRRRTAGIGVDDADLTSESKSPSKLKARFSIDEGTAPGEESAPARLPPPPPPPHAGLSGVHPTIGRRIRPPQLLAEQESPSSLLGMHPHIPTLPDARDLVLYSIYYE